MNAQRKTFCEYYVQSYNAQDAYRKAYGTSNTGNPYRILKDPECKAYIEELQVERKDRFASAADAILVSLLEDGLTLDNYGNHSKTWQKSLDLAQKQLGLQSAKVDLNAEEKVEINVRVEDE